MTAKQQNELRRPPVPPETVTDILGHVHFMTLPARHEVEIERTQEIGTGEQPEQFFLPPKCAALFNPLRKAHWTSFGFSSSFPSRADLDLESSRVHSLQVYNTLWFRLEFLRVLEDYAETTSQAIVSGMNALPPRAFDSQAYFDLGKRVVAAQHRLSYFVEDTDTMFMIGRSLKSLLDAVGVPEALLICFDEDEADEKRYRGILPAMVKTDEEWNLLLSRLLAPALQLKETCLKLSGLVNMIQRLNGTNDSELRSFLAHEIRRRVEEVLGNPEDDDDFSGDDDDSMADAED